MDQNAEAFLRRKKAGSKLDRLAMRGPARVLIRHFLQCLNATDANTI